MRQFFYLPFFPNPLNKCTVIDRTVNRLHLFNFWNYKDKYIPDLSVRSAIENYCKMYVDETGNQLEQVTIAVLNGNYECTPYSKSDIDSLMKYALALMFCTVSVNDDNGAWAGENFNIYHQDFDLETDWIHYKVGSYVTLTQSV